MASPQKQNQPVSFDALLGLAQELDGPLHSLAQTSQKLVNDYKSRNFEYVSYKDFKAIISTLESINKQLKHCCQTTERMMRLGKTKGAAPESCPVNEMVHEIVGLLNQQLKSAHIKVVTHLAPQLPLAAIGKVDCYQIIHNILINAIQAMPAGGRIKVRTGLDRAKRMVTVDIEDEGVGIPAGYLPKVFEPFFTTKERGVEKSSGLGLSVVQSIIHAAGGDIHIQSSLRKGTSVHIDLPLFAHHS